MHLQLLRSNSDFFLQERKLFYQLGKKAYEIFPLIELNLQITGALHTRIIHSDHRGGPEEYQISTWAHFFSQQRGNCHLQTQAPQNPCATSSEALPSSPFPALDNQFGLRHHCPSLRSTGEVQMLAQSCWSFLAEGGWDWENPSRVPTSGSPAGQTHMLSGLFHTTLHSVNKMDF